MKKSIFQASVAVASTLLPAGAFAVSVGSGVPSVAVTLSSAESYNRLHIGVEVQAWLIPSV